MAFNNSIRGSYYNPDAIHGICIFVALAAVLDMTVYQLAVATNISLEDDDKNLRKRLLNRAKEEGLIADYEISHVPFEYEKPPQIQLRHWPFSHLSCMKWDMVSYSVLKRNGRMRHHCVNGRIGDHGVEIMDFAHCGDGTEKGPPRNRFDEVCPNGSLERSNIRCTTRIWCLDSRSC